MDAAMAANLIRVGHPLRVYNRSPKRRQAGRRGPKISAFRAARQPAGAIGSLR